MNKKNEVLIAKVIQDFAEGLEGKITSHQRYTVYKRDWLNRIIKEKTVVEICFEEVEITEVKKNGRPISSVKTLAQ